jgi:uncharacterized coiled-coil protein SlyX
MRSEQDSEKRIEELEKKLKQRDSIIQKLENEN